jgi:hypothetical protein
LLNIALHRFTQIGNQVHKLFYTLRTNLVVQPLGAYHAPLAHCL